jgi:hypothetical protein
MQARGKAAISDMSPVFLLYTRSVAADTVEFRAVHHEQ